MTDSVQLFTRAELFDLVWAKPAGQVAADLGIAETALRSICSRHDIPCPSEGYWSRVYAGQSFRLPSLREAKNPELERIEIKATITASPKPAVTPSAFTVSATSTPAADEVDLPAKAAPQVENLRPPVASTAHALRKAKPDEDERVAANGPGLCGLVVHQDRVERVLGVLQDIASALEAEGLTLQPDDQRMKIVEGMGSVTFTLTERTRREKHIPTVAEQALYDQQQARRQRAADRRNWDLYSSLPYGTPWPEYDTVYTGQLALVADGWSDGLRKTWADGKTQRLEAMIAGIVAGLKAILASKKAREEKWAEDKRQRAELDRRRNLAKKRKEREEARIDYLRSLVQLQREAVDIRSWLATLPEGCGDDPTTELARMAKWAQVRLADLEVRTTVEAAAMELEGKALFPSIDELHDSLGDPPEPRYYW